MDKNLLIIRKVKHEDAKGWFELHNKVSRDACSHKFLEEDTIYVNDGIINFIGSRPYYEFNNGDLYMKQMIKLDQEKEAINKDIEIAKRRTGSTTEQVTIDSNNSSFGRK